MSCSIMSCMASTYYQNTPQVNHYLTKRSSGVINSTLAGVKWSVVVSLNAPPNWVKVRSGMC